MTAMDANGSSNTMSVPPPPPTGPVRVQQSSIRSFFQPRTPTYTPPPNARNTTANSVPAPVPALSAQSSVPSPPPSNNGAPSTIPEQATISPVDPSHIQPLRRINSLLLPINYPDSFYHKIIPDPSSTPSFSRVILWQDSPSNPPKVVGGIVCRLDPALAPDSTPIAPKYIDGVFDIYVQSLALLSPYRGHGLAAAALKSIIDSATGQTRVRIAGLYAHVWTDNEEALGWYAARGFNREEPIINGYYKRLKPDSAWILRRKLSVGDHLAQAAPSRSPVVAAAAPPTEDILIQSTALPKSLPTQASRPPAMPHTASFQDRRPDREWNDLPEDVLGSSLLKPPSGSNSKDGSAASSRSSSRSASGTKKKKERLYPAAAFGS
jgi:ribosomal protein S18 acetylase RimI-like enzyme